MSIIKKMRKQKAIWWARGEPDQYGAYAFLPPVEIDCRWDDSSAEFRDAEGQGILSNATVYPDRVMKKGDKLMKGTMDSNTPDDPLPIKEAFEIQRFDETPNLRATEFLYTAFL